VPVDIYEWLHVFECLLRADRLSALDLRSVLFRPPNAAESRWAELARQRLRADYRRMLQPPAADLGQQYQELEEAYDRGGLPFERALARLSHARWLIGRQAAGEAASVNSDTLTLAQQHGMRVVEADAWHMAAAIARARHDPAGMARAAAAEAQIRRDTGYAGKSRP
jgi:hypothetical protein